MGTFPITVPYTFATATSPIPLNKLDTDFTTLVTAVNGISSGTYPLASPAIQGGTMSGTITLSGTITGSAGAVNPGTVSTTGSITAGTTISASGTITSSSTVQGTAVTATTGNITATAGDVVAGGKVKAGGSYPLLESVGSYTNLNFSSTTGISYNGSGQINFSVTGTPELALTTSAFTVSSGITCYNQSGSWVASSDKNLKTNIKTKDFKESTKKIMSLNPVDFEWKKDNRKDAGFIAQEYEQVYPNSVVEYTDEDTHEVYKAIGINRDFYADLVATIQELRTELDALKAKVGA